MTSPANLVGPRRGTGAWYRPILLLSLGLLVVVAAGGTPSVGASVSKGRQDQRQTRPPEHASIRVRLAVTASLLRTPSWSRELSQALRDANDILAPHLGRSLQAGEPLSWDGESHSAGLEDLLLELVRVVPRGEADVVVGLVTTADQGDTPSARRGLAHYEDGYTVIAVGRSLAESGRLLAHEVAHLFGAVHVDGPQLLMSPETKGGRIDPINAALLGLHADRRFEPGTFPLRSNHLEAARDLYLQVVEGEPAADAEARQMLARLDIETARYDRAIDALEGMLAADERDPEARLLLAVAYRRSHRYEAAIALYDELLGERPADYRLHYNRGIALYNGGNVEAAIQAYREAALLAPHFTPALSNLAAVYARQGRAREAVAAAQGALAIDADDPMAMANLGYAYFIAGDHQAARAVTTRLLADHPDTAAGYNTLGKVLEAEGRLREAMATYRRAVDSDPQYVEGFLSLAQAHMLADELAAAAAAVDQALLLRPRSATAHAIRAGLHLRQGSWSEAVTAFQTALDLEPDAAGVRGQLGYAHLMAGDLGPARAYTLEELERDPEQAWCWTNLGVIASREGDLSAAAEAYQRAIEIDPEYLDAHLNLGHTNLALGLLDEAAVAYEVALARGGETGLVRNNLATIHYRRGAFEQAWQEALQALKLGFELHPEFAGALELATGRKLPRGAP